MGKVKTVDSPAQANPLAGELSELGLALDTDGRAQIRMLTTASTDVFSGQAGQIYSCDPQLAVRLVRRGYAEAFECSPTE
jgi:hypothetical protein